MSYKLQNRVGMYAVVFEDEEPLGIELKGCIGLKKPNKAQPFLTSCGECSLEYSILWTTL